MDWGRWGSVEGRFGGDKGDEASPCETWDERACGLFVLRMNFVTRCFLCPLQMEEQARQWLTESR